MKPNIVMLETFTFSLFEKRDKPIYVPNLISHMLNLFAYFDV